ncbi:FAD/NAD(P)-binding protein [Rubrivivax gelatinosus]|uniref:FAD/NAD(P)-binding protein n=1 Tax=Rubrivivax gelatinosus TaxID=28068 RepID=UPI0018C96FC2|nr:FAD/NAD(P)-binding protein [Rubrivivax gelatinosus]
MSLFPAGISKPGPLRVGVVGAGFSGTAVAVHLLAALPAGSRVDLFERDARCGRGLAYGTSCPSHWLNVPAGGLALDPQQPEGFVLWLQQRFPGFAGGDFVPRMLLGQYLADELAAAEAAGRSRGVSLQRHRCEVLDLERDDEGYRVCGPGAPATTLDRLVLATGHLPPRPPVWPGADWQQPGFVADPGAAGWLDTVEREAELLVLGSGLSAVDVVLALQDRGHRGAITLLSRRGQWPQAHRDLADRPDPGASPAPLPDWSGLNRVRPMMRTLRQAAAEAAARGCDWRDVMARLRPEIPAAWQRLGERERRQFLRHVQPWWDSHRHRVAPGIAARLAALRASGLLHSAAGRLRQTEHRADGRIELLWDARGGGPARMTVDRVINCTGTSTDLRGGGSPLLARLHAKGWLQADPLGLGLQIDADLSVPGQAGLFYIGPMLKARDWEATAIPELRVHALRLAGALAGAVTAVTPTRSSPAACC